jgi:hypothetical protein
MIKQFNSRDVLSLDKGMLEQLSQNSRWHHVREAAKRALERFTEAAVPCYMPEDYARAAQYAFAHQRADRRAVVVTRSDQGLYLVPHGDGL